DRTVYVWDANTGRELRRLRRVPWTPINGFLLCADGKTLVTKYQSEHSLRLWSLAGGKELQSSDEAVCPISCVSFSPDGRLVAAGSHDSVIRLWDVVTKKEVRHFQHGSQHSSPVVSVLFSPDGRKLASASLFDPEEVLIWDAANGKKLQRIKRAEGSVVSSLAWSGDGKVLAGWDRADHRIHLWDAATGAELRRLDCGDTSINALAFSPDGKMLAAAGGSYGRGNCLLLWETDTGRLVRSLSPRHTLHCVAFSPDGRVLAASGRRSVLAGDSQEDREISLWEVVSGRQRLTLKYDDGATSLAFSPNGQLLAAACNNDKIYSGLMMGDGVVDVLEAGKPKRQRVRLWDVAAAKEFPPLEGHQGAIRSLSFSPDGKRLATGSNDTTVLLWDATRFKTSRPAQKQLQPEQIESLWADLAGANAVKAYRSIRTLAAAPKESVDFLNRRLKPVAAVDAKRVARLLANLDNTEFAAREKAMRELEKLGDSAATELHKALTGKPPLEAKRRIEQLLDKANGPEHFRMVRALEAVEMMNTPEARELCASLARGIAEARLTREAKATLRRMSRESAAMPR
ncbi:MAG TPA: WD40 repeat domain-containing protein, partial [Gemmataceae bacterium]